MHSLKFPLLTAYVCLFLISCGEVSEKTEAPKHLPQTRQEMTLSFAPVVKKVAPAVVNIYALHQPTQDLLNSPFMADPIFKQFFEHFYGNDKKTREQFALGSGIIVSPDGLILTNYHVIKNAEIIQIALADRREFTAKLIMVDKRTDLALLQIESKTSLPFLKVTLQEDLEVGDLVLAIGNPFGIGQTVTNGIVSALARSEKGISDFRTFIQTDAAINPGNSGGPLVTTDGRLVGINTAIYSKTGGNVGIGFAIPTSLAIPLIESVKNGGRISRPWLGLEVESVSSEMAQALGLSHPYGVLVKSVYPQGPGDEAGIKVGDLIAAIGGREVEDEPFFDYQVAISPLGEKIELTLLRKGKETKVPIVLSEPQDEKNPEPLTIEGHNPFQGVKIRTLSPALSLQLGLNPMAKGVVITEIESTTPAAKLGLQPGDVIENINKKKVTAKEEMAEILKSPSSSWNVVFLRGEKSLTLQILGK